MQQKIDALRSTVEAELMEISTPDGRSEFFTKYLGKNGQIQALMKGLGGLSKEERPAAGKLINSFREEVLAKFKDMEAEIEKKELQKRYERESIDISMPSEKRRPGVIHPVSLIKSELLNVFMGMGFTLYEGPEIEDDYHNFTALNTPQDHPARDKQDTFYITEDLLLRTHTSPGQIRCLEELEPPFKVVIPGRVFRADDDATHLPMFHQMEGLVIDKGLSMCDLYGLLDKLAKSVFSPDTKTRFRPSYFPFTEPSVEVDLSCFECGGEGCRLCSQTGWIEILGGGVVNRKVIANCGLDPDVYTGLAFGTGIDRMAMLKYGVNNIHILYDGDSRIVKQFRG